MSATTRTWSVTSTDPSAEREATAWIRAVCLGFAQPAPPDKRIRLWLDELIALRVRARGVYDDGGLIRDAALPVATLSSWDTTVNIGGTMLTANAISDATTVASHRRRGLLRSLLTDDLTEAAARGLPLATLTVTESGIYRRFGFGPAVQTLDIRVRTDAAFAITRPNAGHVEVVDREQYLTHARALFDDFHRRSSGSVDRTPGGLDAMTGLDMLTGEPEPAVRHALHIGADGQPDAAACWKVDDETARVTHFVAPDPANGIALWDFLAHIDLVSTVTQKRVRVDDPLRYALTEPDVYTVENRHDFLWLRVLDVAAVLQARRYLADGDIVLRVDDLMGLADGTYRVTVTGSTASVRRTEAHPDVTCDVAALGSMLLGGVGVYSLAAAGHVHAREVAGLDDLATLMACAAPPASITPF